MSHSETPATSERLPAFECIDRGLDKRQELADQLGQATTLLVGRLPRETMALLTALRRCEKAEALLSGQASCFLPLIVSLEQGDEERRIGLAKSFAMFQRSLRRKHWENFTYLFFSLVIITLFTSVCAYGILPSFVKTQQEFGLSRSGGLMAVQSILQVIPVIAFLACLLTLVGYKMFSSIRRMLDQVLDVCQATFLMGWIANGRRSNVEAASQFSANVAELLHLQVPMEEAVAWSAKGVSRPFLRNHVHVLLREVKDIKPHDATRYPPLILNALRSEVSLDDRVSHLRSLARMYQDKASCSMQSTYSAFIPVFMLFMGIFVGGFVIGFFLPFFQLIKSLSGG
jgi:type II secretory pathway component PulF